jgi:hypothetical protein
LKIEKSEAPVSREPCLRSFNFQFFIFNSALPLSSASELAYRGEVHGEVVGGGPEGVAHDAGLFGGDVLDAEAHVGGQFAAATAAEGVSDRFVEVATGTTAFPGELGQLLLGQHLDAIFA